MDKLAALFLMHNTTLFIEMQWIPQCNTKYSSTLKSEHPRVIGAFTGLLPGPLVIPCQFCFSIIVPKMLHFMINWHKPKICRLFAVAFFSVFFYYFLTGISRILG